MSRHRRQQETASEPDERLARLARNITELVEHCATAEWVSGLGTHRTEEVGLLAQAENPNRVVLTVSGGSGPRRAPGSKPPGRWDLMSLTDFVHRKAEKLRERVRGQDFTARRSVVESLRDLEVLATSGTKVGLICSQVDSWTGTAKVALGYAPPPVQTKLRCTECKTQLVAPATETGRYLLCPNQECVDEDGRRRKWSEYQVTALLRAQEALA